MLRRPLTRTLAPLMLLAIVLVAIGCKTAEQLPQDACPWRTLDGSVPQVIAHRGDSGHFPEHTLAGYQSALKKGADFIEPDIVLTRDGVPVCRHDLHLSGTTDVASRPQFAGRRRQLGNKTDWFVIDFTLAELKTLRAIQHIGGRDRSQDGRYEVPTLAQAIELVHQFNQNQGGSAGVLIEIKTSPHYAAMGLDVSGASMSVVQSLAEAQVQPPIIYQCFDRGQVERIAQVQDHPVHWLTSDAVDLDNLPAGISGLGVNKDRVEVVDGRSELIDAVHASGLAIHCWTFRDDRLPDDLRGQPPLAEMLAYLQAGADGVITDFPATGMAARQSIHDAWVAEQNDRDSESEESEPLGSRVRQNSPRRYLR